MKSGLKFRLFLYRFFSTNLGKIILQLLSFGVKVSNLSNSKKPKKYPFLVVITIDTESGYVNKNERRTWQKENPEAFIGYYLGIKNLMKIFDKHKIKTTFFLSTQCFSSKGNKYNSIKTQLNNLYKNKHEIGLHLHPDSDLALQKKLSKKFKATTAFSYNYQEKLEILRASKELIKKHLGQNVCKRLLSFRWGNWALDSDGVKALNEVGFKVDSSATPGIKGHLKNSMKYDWSKTKRHYPWKLSIVDYQNTNHNNSNITEIPICSFMIF